MEQKELQKIVNPIYTTAKGTIITLAAGGDQNAIALCPYLELEELSGRAPAPPGFQKVYAVGQEARFQVYNNAARKRAEPVIVDLPSGYSPRGFVMADAGKQYYGLDLPAVIDLMAPAARETMTDAQKQHARYIAADATDYASVRRALDGVNGEICVVTEGLLGYLSESELENMCLTVNRLLSEFGGCWITADTGMLGIYSAVYTVLIDPDPTPLLARMRSKGSAMSDVSFYQNSLFTQGNDGAVAFLNRQGFAVKAESVGDYVYDLRTVDADTEKRVARACRDMAIWTLTVATPAAECRDADPPFAVDTEETGGTLTLRVRGRLDTLTAPELLKQYLDRADKAEHIEIDTDGVTYVSSAGERALRMIRQRRV